jgi:hypothetical protein
MSNRKADKQRVALSRRRVAQGLFALLITAAVPTASYAEDEIYEYHRRRRHARRRRCSYHSRRC